MTAPLVTPPVEATPMACPFSPSASCGAAVDCVRSELVRVLRPTLRLIGLGLAATFAVLTTVVTFMTAEPASKESGSAVAPSFASIEVLQAPGGFFGAFELLARFLGLAVLAIWALSVAGDYSSGFIRMMVQAQPNRRLLFTGKVFALSCFTVMCAGVAALLALLVAYGIAGPADIETSNWSPDLIPEVLSGLLNLSVACIAWGCIGLLVATLTRSAGLAIGLAVGWLLLLEPLIGLASQDFANYLPGGIIGAVATGGNDSIAWSTAILLTIGYAVISVGAALTVFARRDITE
jgi:ABC-2 type transport system permease protein